MQINRPDLWTILTDAALQVNRAKPADRRLDAGDWAEPGTDWWESFEETVDRQLVAYEERHAQSLLGQLAVCVIVLSLGLAVGYVLARIYA